MGSRYNNRNNNNNYYYYYYCILSEKFSAKYICKQFGGTAVNVKVDTQCPDIVMCLSNFNYGAPTAHCVEELPTAVY
jgi:hypothetical protein